jgi:hypothetical protein
MGLTTREEYQLRRLGALPAILGIHAGHNAERTSRGMRPGDVASQAGNTPYASSTRLHGCPGGAVGISINSQTVPLVWFCHIASASASSAPGRFRALPPALTVGAGKASTETGCPGGAVGISIDSHSVVPCVVWLCHIPSASESLAPGRFHALPPVSPAIFQRSPYSTTRTREPAAHPRTRARVVGLTTREEYQLRRLGALPAILGIHAGRNAERTSRGMHQGDVISQADNAP